ncbi:FG-GAP-like repeat-containing protein [Lysobacter sp. KIS68-7]|uniref:FG-GAP-like repeat-containing protein n=1 Tax=Lysobacter sp. KIS68-7 TaxID=2904252 RepID=UPI001E451D3A|nr:FG-GAP-like repeat-containing protein [Lysobacter sp. KIS68-7]UHQ19565.1 FG-GAP-like repeat-containing protein [Lysobacter sp. KIS68-7]
MNRGPACACAWFLLAIPVSHAFATTHDFDGDGRDDVFWRNTRTGANALWPSGNSAAQAAMPGVANGRWTVAGVGDFDGDGHADLLWRNRANGANTIWRSGNPTTQQPVATVADLDWRVAGVGDFNGDGHSDVLWHNARTGRSVYWRSASSGAQHAVATVSPAMELAGIGDFDGNGADDLVWRNRDTGANVLWPSGEWAYAEALKTVPIDGASWQVVGVGDFDGDGHADLLWRNAYGVDLVWRSGRSTTWTRLAEASTDWQVAAVGDFDGDGRSDLFWRNYYDGRNVVWRSGNASTGLRRASASNMDWSIEPFDAQPTMPVLEYRVPASIMEGNSGTQSFTFRVHASHPADRPVHFTVFVEGEPDATLATPGVDFLAPSESALTIAPGETTLDVTVTVVGDAEAEANERIVLASYGTDDGMVFGNLGEVIILNDDANTLWITGAATWEGNSGVHPLNFTLDLSRPQATAATCLASTTAARNVPIAPPLGGGNATAGTDFVPKADARVTIPAGAVEATLAVDVIGDTIPESLSGEWLGVQLRNCMGAVVVGDFANGFIRDDEIP